MPKIPVPIVDDTPSTIFNGKKCKNCTFGQPCTPEDDEMTIGLWLEYPHPAKCRNRKSYACIGSIENFKRLGLGFEGDEQVQLRQDPSNDSVTVP